MNELSTRTVVHLRFSLEPGTADRLVGPVVKAPTSRADDPGFHSRLRRGDFSGSSHTSELKTPHAVSTTVVSTSNNPRLE